jgi:hypothetical protein
MKRSCMEFASKGEIGKACKLADSGSNDHGRSGYDDVILVGREAAEETFGEQHVGDDVAKPDLHVHVDSDRGIAPSRSHGACRPLRPRGILGRI